MVMNIKGNETKQKGLELQSDPQPLIALFDLLLEWDMKDVHENAETRKEVPEKV